MPTIRTLESNVAGGVFVYVERSKEIAKLFASLVKAQGEFEEVRKNRTGQYGQYADLASLRKATTSSLANNGLAVFQTFHLVNDEMILNTTLAHSSGEYMSTQVPIKAASNPQQTTATVTYYRRMSYSAMLCLASEEDDDGEGAADAAASAAGASKKDLLERARKSLVVAESDAVIVKVLQAVEQYETDGTMPAGATDQMRKVAELRRAQLKGVPK